MRRRGFIRSLRALEPRLDQVVITGGWCWYLYRKYLTDEANLPGEFTLDIDLVLPRRLARGGPSLDELLAADDYEPTMEGGERPPATRYSATGPEAIVEFLTPAIGAGEEATMKIAGVVAQQLRFLNLLLDDPHWLEIDERDDNERFAGRVRVPGVGFFALQKALSFRRRTDHAKRYKDLFYIFDLSDDSRGLLPKIEKDLRACAGKRGLDWIREAADMLEEDCGNPESDAIGRVLQQIPEEQRPSRTYVAETYTELVRIMRRSDKPPAS